jgi:hypothetical protein
MKIEKLYAYIVLDEQGNEGIPAMELNGLMYPLVGADMERIQSLQEQVQYIANKTGKQIRLALFEKRVDQAVIIQPERR